CCGTRCGSMPGDLRATDLIRAGFREPDRARGDLAALSPYVDPLFAALSGAADPDLALASLVRLADAVDERDRLLSTLAEDEETAARLLRVLGASSALGDHLVRHPEQWRELGDP